MIGILRILRIKMNRPEIRFHMIPSAGIVDRTGRIQFFGQIIQEGHIVRINGRIFRRGFIIRRPCDDGRMTEVANDNAFPFTQIIQLSNRGIARIESSVVAGDANPRSGTRPR